MTPLDRLDALEREATTPARAIAYQDLLHIHGRALIDVARAAEPYLEKAAPGEHLFDGQDLRDFQRLDAAFAPLLLEPDDAA